MKLVPPSKTVSKPDVESSELVGIIAAIIILIFMFGTLTAMSLPILTALIGVGTGLALIGLLGHGISVPTVGPTLGTMLGLGVGIDYALFIVSRHKGFMEQGFDITLYEQNNFLGGKLGAHKDDDKTDPHEHCYHMYLNWYNNFWKLMAEIGESASDAIVTPAFVLLGHSDDESLHIGGNAGPSRVGAMLRAVELAGDQTAIPSEDGFRLRNTGYLRQTLPPQPLANLGERKALGVRKPQVSGDV